MYLFLYLIPYIIISIIDLYSCFYRIQNLIYLSKPLVLLYLFFFYLLCNTQNNLLIMFGIVLSLAGDIYLMFNELLWEGIIVFWISDILYVITLYKMIRKQNNPNTFKVLPVLFCVYLFIFLFFPFKALYPYLGSLAVPVIIYGITLFSLNMLSTFLLIFDGGNMQNIILFIATVCYMISDFILLRGMVAEAIKHNLFYVMLSYIIAQGGMVYCFVSKETGKY